MQKTFIVKQIVQADKRGAVMLQEKTADEKTQPAVQIAITFTDPKEAAAFTHGAEVPVTIG